MVLIAVVSCQYLTDEEEGRSGLQEFSESFSKFTRFSSFRPLATLRYEYSNHSSIVSR